MYARFGQIFWGLLLVIVDLKISGLDILPDFIGYSVVAVGADGLALESDRFRIVRNLGCVLALLSFASVFLPGVWLQELLMAALDCAVIWYLLGGVMDISSARDRLDLAEQASKRRIAYLIITSILVVVGLVARGMHGGGDLLAVMAGISMLILVILILHLIYRVRHEIAFDDA